MANSAESNISTGEKQTHFIISHLSLSLPTHIGYKIATKEDCKRSTEVVSLNINCFSDIVQFSHSYINSFSYYTFCTSSRFTSNFRTQMHCVYD